MNKPTKPNIIIPESFAQNGVKTEFDNEKLLNGFDRLQPDVLAGDNLNKFIDDTYKANNYALNLGDYVLGKNQVTNCILEAPNGVATFTGSSITLKQGLKMLIPDKLNADKTLKNKELTLIQDEVLDISAYSGQSFNFELMFGCFENDTYLSQNYQESIVAPSTSGYNQIYLNTKENQMYFGASGQSSWIERTFIKLGRGRIENGVITSFTPYNPLSLAKEEDIDGKWVIKKTNLITETQIKAKEKKVFDLSIYLPQDNNIYEVIVSGRFYSASGASKVLDINFSSDIVDVNLCFLRLMPDSGYATDGSNTIIVPVGSNRTLTCYNSADYPSANNGCNVYVMGYRKVR